MTVYTLEPDGSKDFGPCACCGHNIRNVWGFVYRDGDAYAIYYVQWTLGGVGTHGAHFVIDASSRPVATNSLVGRAMSREEVIGTSLANEVFEVADAVWAQEARIKEVTGGLTMGSS